MSSAADNKPRENFEPLEKAAVRIVIGIVVDLRRAAERGHSLVGGGRPAVQRLPISFASVISPRFIARLIKGCRVDAVPIFA
jgi:hypothetical protein